MISEVIFQDSDLDSRQLTFRCNAAFYDDLQWIASKSGSIGIASALKKAIATEKFLLSQQDAGDVIVLENKETGVLRELILK
jgi:hypothetical protein